MISFREIYLPLMFIAILIGYQITAYFFYQYLKYRKERIEMQKLLLAYALVFGLTLTAFTIRIVNLYFFTMYIPSYFKGLIRLTYLLLYLGIMAFYLVISSKDFDKILNRKMLKILSLALIIPICSIFILEIETLIFSIIAGLTLLIYYSIILFFHLQLIKLTTGDIQMRLKLILVGIILLFLSHGIGGYTPSYILLEAYSEVLQVVSVPLFITGLMTFLLGVYKFPVFLEFDWKKHLLALFIIDKTKDNILYTYYFMRGNNEDMMEKKSKKTTEENKFLFSQGIVGMERIISLVSESTDQNIHKIKHGDMLILLSHGEGKFSHVAFCLLVKKELNSLKYLIKQTKKEFISLYSPVLDNLNNSNEFEKEIFSGFDKELEQIMVL